MTDIHTEDASAAGSRSRFDGWKAVQDVQPIIQQPSLHVYGKYDTKMRSGGAELRVHLPPGFNPKILLLDLLDTQGPGGIVDVEGRFDADKEQYDSVKVTNKDGESVTIPVEEVQ